MYRIVKQENEPQRCTMITARGSSALVHEHQKFLLIIPTFDSLWKVSSCLCEARRTGVRWPPRQRRRLLQKRTWSSSRIEKPTSDSWRSASHPMSPPHGCLPLLSLPSRLPQLTPASCLCVCVFQSDILDVNQIFKDLAVMIHDQGEMIGERHWTHHQGTMHINTSAPLIFY